MAVDSLLEVSGLSCEGCVETVTDRLMELAGVHEVSVELSPGGVSLVSVRSDAELDREQAGQALSEGSGFRLV